MAELKGKKLVLENLKGNPTSRIPVGLFTSGYEYLWKVAGLEPWQLALGGTEAWHKAHMALLELHEVDLILYCGAGEGLNEPTLLEEDEKRWKVRNNNTGAEVILRKDNLAPETYGAAIGSMGPDRNISTFDEVDRLVEKNPMEFIDTISMDGLKRLISDAGDDALVVPQPITAYIKSCYLLGFDTAMRMLVEKPALFKYTCDKYAAREDYIMQQYAKTGVEVVFVLDSWASCDLISPKMFHEFVLPYHKSIIDAAHKAGLQVILWNPGNILPILDQEATVDMDAFAFEQPRKGVDILLSKVRQAFRHNRCLFGNFDSELTLMNNDKDEIRGCVRRLLEQNGKNAPFVFFTGSPLPSNIEIDAVDTMVKAVRAQKLECGSGDKQAANLSR